MLSVAHSCTVDSQNGTSRALCNNKGLREVPQDLNDNTRYLDLSDNRNIQNLNADSFKKYKSLTYLSLRNCYISSDLRAPFDGFKSLDKLEELDISGLQHKGAEKKYVLPTSLKILKMNKTDIGDLVAPDLLKLEYVDLSDNLKMKAFPLFNEIAKVQTVILNNVKMDHLVVTQIAGNCHLKRLDLAIDFEGGSGLLEPNKYCECIYIHRWLKQFSIKSNLLERPDDVKCRKLELEKNDLELCPKDETYNAALAKRDKCLNAGKLGFSWVWILAGVLILTLIGMVIVMFILDIRIAAHIRAAHAALTGKQNEDNDDEETPSEDQPQQEEQTQPDEQKQ